MYAGVTSLECTIPEADKRVPELWQLVNGGSLFAPENGKTISFFSKGDGTLSFLVGLKTPENWLATSGIDVTSRASVAAWFKQEFSSWSPQWQQLFATDALTIVPRPWYYYPSDQYWQPQPNLTMIGDAAHRIPPYAGEGANQALADALDLAEALCGSQYATIEQAIAAFEQQMRSRMVDITAMTIYYTEAMHAENNQQFLLDLFSGGSEGQVHPEIAG